MVISKSLLHTKRRGINCRLTHNIAGKPHLLIVDILARFPGHPRLPLTKPFISVIVHIYKHTL